MKRIIIILSLAFVVLVTLFDTTASALPPDPTNTCGGNGECSSEAHDVNQRESDLWSAASDKSQASREYQICQSECAGNVLPEPEPSWCQQTYCDIERDAYFQALTAYQDAAANYWSASNALSQCIQSCG